MKKLLSRHYFLVFVIVGVLAGCIYTGNWLPFMILLGVFAFFIVVAILIVLTTQSKGINIYIFREGGNNNRYVSDEHFNEDHDSETIH